MGFVELLSAPWFWLALGFMLLLLELMAPGTILLWFGVGAILTAGVAWLTPGEFPMMNLLSFGVLSLVVLVIQIVTGIWLVMNYKPDAEFAFASVEYIMRDVDWGWLIRYMHSTGASAFFVVIYLHMYLLCWLQVGTKECLNKNKDCLTSHMQSPC